MNMKYIYIYIARNTSVKRRAYTIAVEALPALKLHACVRAKISRDCATAADAACAKSIPHTCARARASPVAA